MRALIACDPPVEENGQNVGGTHSVVGHILSEFRARGHEPILVTGAVLDGLPAGKDAYTFVEQLLDSMQFDLVHIVTQGWLGFLVRQYCRARKLRFTAAYHTKIPEYMEVRWGIPSWIPMIYIRWFLNGAETVIVPTPIIAKELTERGVHNVVACQHGVDADRFHPGDKSLLDHLPRPIWLFVGRLVDEKNVEALLRLDLPGTKVIVGDGDLRAELGAKYPDAKFVGVKKGDELAAYYRSADCLVFTSLTDTFGLVIPEALASGIPVAAFPVPGPLDVITDPKVGVMDEDLRAACLAAVKLSSDDCRRFAEQRTWQKAIGHFIDLQVPARKPGSRRAGSLRLSLARHNPVLRRLGLYVNKMELRLFAGEPDGPFAKFKKRVVARG